MMGIINKCMALWDTTLCVVLFIILVSNLTWVITLEL